MRGHGPLTIRPDAALHVTPRRRTKIDEIGQTVIMCSTSTCVPLLRTRPNLGHSGHGATKCRSSEHPKSLNNLQTLSQDPGSWDYPFHIPLASGSLGRMPRLGGYAIIDNSTPSQHRISVVKISLTEKRDYHLQHIPTQSKFKDALGGWGRPDTRSTNSPALRAGWPPSNPKQERIADCSAAAVLPTRTCNVS